MRASTRELLSQSEVEFREQFDTVLDRWDVAEGFMGAMVVVSVQPVGRHVTHLLQAIEYAAVEHLGTVGLVESFDIGVLRGLSGLDVIESNALALRPLR